MSKELLFKYVLVLADDALILGQRLSQWAYKGPFLEEDIGILYQMPLRCQEKQLLLLMTKGFQKLHEFHL